MLGTRKVVLWQIGKTDKAYKFSVFPPASNEVNRAVWIPRSVIHHVSRDPAPEGQAPRCTCEVEEWFLDKNEL